MMADRVSDKKKALLAYKEDILKEIHYYNLRIEESRVQKSNYSYFEDDESDSDESFTLDGGPSITQLKLDQRSLQTRLQATQELTSLHVLQSEVNVLVEEPELDGEPPMTEEGIWREVTAECRVDLVPFSITFYAHQANRLFGPTCYRSLRVLPVKAAHETELAKSVLPGVKTPSDAVEVLRSYAVAHRSRRSTLARLAEKYPDSLFMEPKEDGGYILKCANLLEVSWSLQNKWSPISPFHHRMKFDLEYMDESYIKIISQAHKQLTDPTVDTDERTLLMARIISTCLEAQGPTQELYESMESDPESQKLPKRRTTLDQEPEAPIIRKKKDSEVMAPPKCIPKKSRPKGKENSVDNSSSKAVKRSIADNDVAKNKKARTDGQAKDSVAINKELISDSNEDSAGKSVCNVVSSSSVSKVANSKNEDLACKSKPDKNKNVTSSKNSVANGVGRSKNSESVKQKTSKNYAKISEHGNTDKTNKALTNSIGRNDNDKTESDKTKTNNKQDNKTASKKHKLDKNQDNAQKDPTDNNGQAKRGKLGKNETVGKKVDNKSSKDNDYIKKSTKITENSKNQTDNHKANHNKKPNEVMENSSNKNTNDGNTRNIVSRSKSASKNLEVTSKVQEDSRDAASTNQGGNILRTKGNLQNEGNKVHSNGNSKDNIIGNTRKPKTTNEQLEKDNTKNTKSASNKDVLEKDSTINVARENASKDSAKIVKPAKSSNVKEDRINDKIRGNEKKIQKTTTNSNSDNIAQTVVIKNKNSANTRISDKISDKIELVDRNIVVSAKVNKILTAQIKKSKPVESNANTKDRHTDKTTVHVRTSVATKVSKNIASLNNNIVPQIKNIIDVNENNKVTKHLTNINTDDNKLSNKLAAKTTKNKINTKSPVQKSKIKLLNPRNKPKLSAGLKKNTQKQIYSDIQNTKIPQKLASVREEIMKKNPLRISPRKMQSKLLPPSLDNSKSSQRSNQKTATGIPRLMKKPVVRPKI